MNLPYLSSKTVTKLKETALRKPENFVSAELIGNLIENHGGCLYSKHSNNEPPPRLASSSESDFENAVLIHSWICGFSASRSQLADGRLWSALSLTTFSSYTLERWALSSHKSNASKIHSRYLSLGTSQRSLIRNAISRLFWTAELTSQINGTQRDYSLTKVAFLKQDIQQNFMERAFCTNREIIINSMKHLLKKISEDPTAVSKKRIQTYARLLNNAGGTATLETVATSSSGPIFNRCFD
jgi:hypothetical protein